MEFAPVLEKQAKYNMMLPESAQKSKSAILSEKFAIVTCGLGVAVVAIPLLVVIQALAISVWGTIAVRQLLDGKGLFDEHNEL